MTGEEEEERVEDLIADVSKAVGDSGSGHELGILVALSHVLLFKSTSFYRNQPQHSTGSSDLEGSEKVGSGRSEEGRPVDVQG